MTKKIKVTQIRNGKRVTFLTPDKGKPGKTPKDEQWYRPGVETGWKKEMPEGERRRLVLQAHKGDELASGRSMQAKANVTTDRETKQRARADAQYFFKRHRIGKGAVAPEVRGDEIILAAHNLVETEGSQRVGQYDWVIEGDTVSVAHAVTGREYGEINLATGELLPVRTTDRVALQSVYNSIVTATERSIAKQKLDTLMDFPFKNKKQIDAIITKYPELKPATPKAPVTPKKRKGRVGNLQQIHARRSTQAQVRDEQQRHQVTIEVDSPRVKVWLKDPSAADIKGIDTPGARTLRRKGTPRITPKTPKLRR